MRDTVEKAAPRILVIDDNESIHADFRAILEPRPGERIDLTDEESTLFGKADASLPDTLSFELDHALQGEEGVEKVRQALRENRPYAMAFVDIRMPPGMDGVETIKEIWRECPDMEMVICSAYSDYSWQDMMKEFGHTDKLLILKKPFDNIEVQQLAASLTLKWKLMNRLDQMVQRRTREIYRCFRQMECLNRISTLLEPAEIDWEVTLPAIVDLIPSGLQTPHRAGVKLTIKDQEFQAANLAMPTRVHRQEIRVGTTAVGTLEVGYRQEQNNPEEALLPEDEIELIHTISRRIGCARERLELGTGSLRENPHLQEDLASMADLDC